jgi:hypothetical protein
MEEDLARQWANLSLTEDEDNVKVIILKVQLDKGKNQGKTCVIGKLVADHMVSKETIWKTLMRGWKPDGDLSFTVLGENMFLIDFTLLDDKERVLKWRPWVFAKRPFSD